MKKCVINKLLFAAIIICGVGAITFSEELAVGIKAGIEISLNSVIPSLYIFTVLSLFAVKSSLFSQSGFVRILTSLLFGCSSEIGTVYLLSFFCGYPIGAKLINELYLEGKVSKASAEKMLCFCINPGPAFVISIIGIEVYGNAFIGAILFVSVVLSSVMGIRFYRPRDISGITKYVTDMSTSYYKDFMYAVDSANKSMVSICGWVILSNAIITALKPLEKIKMLLCLIEVTSGAMTAAENYSVYFVAFLIGFGGFSVHMQVLSCAKDFNPNYIKILLSKVIQGAVTSAFCYILLRIFPQTVNVSNNFKFEAVSNSVSPLSSAVLVVFVVTTLIFMNKKIKMYGKAK